MAAAHEKQPVQALGTDRADPALGERVRPGRLHGRQQHLGTLGAEPIADAAAEPRVSIVPQQAQVSCPLPQPQQQVASLLGDPGAVRVGGHTAQMPMSGVEFDEAQHLQPSQPDAVHGEAGRRPGSRPPAGQGTPARWWPSAAVLGRARGGAASFGLRLPRPKSPGAAALLCCAGRPRWGSPWPGGRSAAAPPGAALAVRSGGAGRSSTGDQPPMPAKQRLRPNQEPRPARPWQHPADRGQQHAIGGLQLGRWGPAAEDHELVAQHQDLHVLGGVTAGEQHERWMDRHSVRSASVDSIKVASPARAAGCHHTEPWTRTSSS